MPETSPIHSSPTAAPLATPRGRGRPRLRALLALTIAFAVWLPALHLAFAPRTGDRAALAPPLLAAQLRLWTDPGLREREVGRMRGTNNEWDFMGRSFFVWALAELSLREPENRARYVEVMDRIIDETLAVERDKGIHFFLMSYSRHGDFKVQPARSVFLDGEIALMLGARRLVAERESYKADFAARVRLMEERMRQSPVLSAESYPDECWTFCNTVALAAMRFSDVLDGTDHRAFFKEWIAAARKSLVDPKSGLLVSSYGVDGRVKDGPEGSSIWFVSHCLRFVDEGFARDQYARARDQLARGALGFSWAREWPPCWPNGADVDSGPVIPILEVSAGSSGMAFLGASAFEDRAFWDGLMATLDFAAFPMREGDGRRYAASNQVGDAVLLYSMVQGPLFRKVGAP